MKTFKLIAVLILLPLCLNLFGVWELQRSSESNAELAEIDANLKQVRPDLEALIAKGGSRTPMVELDGQRISADIALSRLATAEGEIATLIPLGAVMSGLAKAVIALGLLAALVGAIGMLGLSWAGIRALHSREKLLHTFTRVSRILPFVLVGHIVAMGTAVSAILAFEGLGIWHAGQMSSGEFKLMLATLMVMAVCLYSIWQMAKQLGVMLRMFEPTSMQVLGHEVCEEQAPALWAHVRALALRLGALAPDHIILGMTEGFYVTSSDVEVLPGSTALRGRTLHIPMMYLGLLDAAETDAVIGHELAHFAGDDTEYSLRFLPIYDGIGRSLGVIAETMLASDLLQRTILRPAFMLGIYFMESFDHAVHHWSRVRELAADAAGAQLGGSLAAASALVRISAIDPQLQERVTAHIMSATNPTPEYLAPADLPGRVLQELAEHPVGLPEEEMATQLPHPSDTHPSNGERVAALQITVEDAVASGTRPVSAALACVAMDRYFADPQAIRARITEDYLHHFVSRDAQIVDELRAQAGVVTGEVKLHEGARMRGTLGLIFCSSLLLLGVGLMLASMLHPSISASEKPVMLIIAALISVFAACLMPYSLRLYLRSEKVALVLNPDYLVFANLKAPLPISHIADFGLQTGAGLRLNLLLEDDAPLPEKTGQSFFNAHANIDKKQRVVQLQLMQFCREGKKLKPEETAELVANYINAGFARDVLKQRFEQG